MGVSENSVPLNPMVNDHYPNKKWLFHWECTQHFQTNPHDAFVKFIGSHPLNGHQLTAAESTYHDLAIVVSCCPRLSGMARFSCFCLGNCFWISGCACFPYYLQHFGARSWNLPFGMLFATFWSWNLSFCWFFAAFRSWNLLLLAICSILELEPSILLAICTILELESCILHAICTMLVVVC